MRVSLKILGTVAVLAIFLIGVLFPGPFPFHFFEPVFKFSCSKVLDGDIIEDSEAGFDNMYGMPIREDSISCGRDRALDAYSVCELEGKLENICGICQFGFDLIEEKGVIIGKMCKPYRYLWEWEYKTLF
jgi:hypothetical protein